MALLSPQLAAHVSDTIYLIDRLSGSGTTGLTGLEAQMNAGQGGGGLSMVRAPGLLNAVTGMPGFNKTSPFGVLMERTGGGSTDHVLVFRGTIFTSACDWLSNATVGMSPGPGGVISHMGFNDVFESLLPQVSTSLERAGKVSTLHIAGHSLGGAVATLFAAHCRSIGIRDVKLYTFGAPRTLGMPFNKSLANEIGPENIRRVYSPSDPVPMIPVFPFLHMNGCDDQINDSHNFISPSAHSMHTNYKKAMNAGWPTRRTGWEMFSVDHWLDVADKASSKPFSTMAYWALNKVLSLLINGIVGGLQYAVMGPMTLLDRLAVVLRRAIDLGGKMLDAVLSFFRIVAKFLGLAASLTMTAAQLTAAVIRSLLGRMLQGVATIADLALRKVV